MEKITIPSDISDPIEVQNPDVSGWYITEHMSTADPNALGWLLAQGWQVWSTSSYSTIININTSTTTITYSLRRTRINSVKVLETLTNDYIAAYNEGRDVNDQRYDYAIDLYKKVIESIEEEFELLDPVGGSNVTALQEMIDGFDSDLTAFENKVRDTLVKMIAIEETTITALDTDEIALVNSFVAEETAATSQLFSLTDGIVDDYETAQKANINAKFDAELAKMNDSLVQRGMYNSTIAVPTANGIERERELALLSVDDTVAKQKILLQEQLASYQNGSRSRLSSFQTQIKEMVYSNKNQSNTRMYQARLALEKLLYDAMADKQTKKFSAQESIWKLVTEMIVQRISLRNEAVVKLCDFVERRTDSYPDLSTISDAVAKIGVGSVEGGSP